MALLSDDDVFGGQSSGLLSDADVFGAETQASYRPGSILGTLGEGAKSTARAVGAAVDTYRNDGTGVVAAAKEQQAAPKNENLEAFYRDIAERTKAVEAKHQPLPESASTWDQVKAKGGELWDSAKEIGSAVVANPVGAGHALVEQLPNSGLSLAGGWLGMKAGAAAGTVVAPGPGTTIGAVVGGLAGMFGANTLLETGNKAMDAGQDGAFTGEERTQAMQEGAIKGGVITGVDALTLGASKWITGATARATASAAEVATRRALADAGIDIADEAAVLAARNNPVIQATVSQAQAEAIEAARLATDTFGKNALRYGAAGALETAGEGLGEYLGELAATGDANMMDAVLESVLSLGQSGAEVAWGAMRNKDQEAQPNQAGQTLDGLGQEMDQTTNALAGEMGNFTNLGAPNAGLLSAPPPQPDVIYAPAPDPDIVTVPNNAGGETTIDRNAGPLSAAVVDTGITQDLLRSQTLLRSFPNQAAAQAELDARPDADRYTIARHPRAKDRFAVVPKDRQTLAALNEASARQQQLLDEEGALQNGRPNQESGEGQGAIGARSGGPVASVPDLLRAGVGTPGSRAAADVAGVPVGAADVTDAALTADAAQTELAPVAVQPVAELPGPAAAREQRLAQARMEAEARGARLVDEEASLAAPEPTPAQINAGNYKKGHVKVGPLNIAVENPVGSTRKGAENGKAWETQMQAHYGYVKRTTGADGDQVDVFMKEGTPSDFSGQVYVIDQFNPATGRFDEHKAMIGYRSQAEAAVAYDAHFADGTGPKRRGSVVAVPMGSFAKWAREGDTSRPLSRAAQEADAAQAEIERSTGKFSPARETRKPGESQADFEYRRAAERTAKRQRRAQEMESEPTGNVKQDGDARRTVEEALSSGDVEILKPADLPSLGKAGNRLSRQAAKQVEQLARAFGKKVVFFSNRDGKQTDGFWMKGNTIYLNADAGISQLRVLGHELTHAMRKEAPEAYAAMFEAVKDLLTDEQIKAQWADYHAGQELVGDITDAQRDFIAEEWMADLAGNRFGESQFWSDMFSRIEGQYGDAAARGIINRLRLAIAKVINQLLKAIRGGKFAVDTRMAEHLERVREAAAKGFADYAMQVKRGVAEVKSDGKPTDLKSTVAFEVAPNPEDKELTAKWNALPAAEQEAISQDLAQKYAQQVLALFGQKLAPGGLVQQVGGYLEDTNTSFSVPIQDPAQAEEIAKVLGFVLRQHSMAAMSAEPFPGSVPMGAVVVADVSDANAKRVYDELRAAIRATDGSPLINGHTTAQGKMIILVPQEDRIALAQRVADHLVDRHDVDSLVAHVAWPEQGENDYGLSRRQEGGGHLPARASLLTTAYRLRDEATAERLQRIEAGGVKRSTARPERELHPGPSEVRRGGSPEPDAARTKRAGGVASEGGSEVRSYGTAAPGAVSVQGFHFSREPRQTLDGRYFGTGLRGAEADRVRQATDARLKERICFYVDAGKGIHPEDGVGSLGHTVRLNNLYDANAETFIQAGLDRALKGNAWANAFESAVLDNGFDGYVSDFGNQRAAVLLGRHSVPVTPATSSSGAAQPRAAQPAAPSILSDPKLPAGQLLGSRWKEILAGKLPGVENLDDARRYYKDEVARAVGVKMSTARLAPNGKPSKLTERQWHQVRTPEFKAWFGDWEKYATTPGGVWADGKGEVSKAVDAETGEPLVVHHGSENGGFTVLDPRKGDKHRSPMIFTAANRATSLSYSGSADEVAMPVVPKTQEEFERYGFTFEANEDGSIAVSNPSDILLAQAAKDAQTAIRVAAEDMAENAEDYAVRHRGIYSLFLNIRSPYEQDFEGANWDGEAPWGTYEVFDGTGDQVYGEDGGRYFSLEDAERRAAEEGGSFQDAQGPGVTTNSVAEEALRYGHDGAIIRQVVDDGGRSGYIVEADDVFVIFDANQAKSATQNTGAFSPGNDDLRFSQARKPWYFSQLSRAVESAPDKVFGTAAQVRLWLTGNAPKMGIKKDELQWSGVLDWLGLQGKAKVSKADVLAYLDQNGVQIQEVVKSSGAFDARNPQLPTGYFVADVTEDIAEENPETEGYAKAVMDEEGWVYGVGNSDEEAIIDAGRNRPDLWEENAGTKYGNYTLPGGENYRELLLTLPPTEVRLPQWKVLRPDGYVEATYASEESARIQAQRRGEGFSVVPGETKKLDGGFRSAHWDELNILAHVRFNDRTAADGSRVLFIEELQSDWGQEGKKKGFLVPMNADRVKEINARLRQLAKADKENEPEWDALTAEKNAMTGSGTPAGPFVTDTKAWLSLGLKRMISYAVENGYDKVAFVNGEQSAERYDLSKQISRIVLHDNSTGGVGRPRLDGPFAGGNLTAYGLNGERVIDGRYVQSESELADTIGKEAAEKLLSAKAAEARSAGVGVRARELSGLDLKVGGEGMKTFYDQIVPQVVGDVLKKLGGKTEAVELTAPKGKPTQYADFAAWQAAPGEVKLSQLGFAVTPEMQAKVAEGLPLFSPARRVGAAIDRTIAKVDHAVDGLSNLPNQFDYLKDRYLALGKVARVDEIVQEIREAFTKTDPANKKAVYAYLTTRGANSGGIPDATVRALAERIKKTIEYVGDQLVARGLLDPEAREHYRDQYLPRMYLRHMLNDQDYKVIGMGKKPSEMGYLKHRKDIPEEIREVVLGEIKDPAFLSANAIGRAMRDVSLLDWMGKIAQNNDWTFPDIFVNWKGKKVTAYWLKAEADRILAQSTHYDPAAKAKAEAMVVAMKRTADTALGNTAAIDIKLYKQIPDTRRYGLLRGMWVRREIFDDIMGASQIVNAEPNWFTDWFAPGGSGTKLTQWWKFTKVALNPPGQIRNFLSNMVMLQLSGVGLHKLPFRLIEAARDIANNGPYWKVAKKYGVTESTFTAQEMFRVKRDLLELEAQTGKANSLRWLMTAGASFLDKVSDLYQFSEALGKTIKIIDEMKKGKSEAEAAIEAQKWLFDYSLVPQSVRLARNAPIGMPFITYQIKVMPRLLEVAAKHPWRFLPWAGLLYGMQMAVASLFGVDDDELEKLKKALPQWLQDRGHTVFLPWRDDDGRIQVADVGYFFPWTWFSTFGKHVADGKIEKALVDDIGGQFSAPIIGAASALMSNYDNFTKRPIYNSADPVSYQAASIANFAYDLMAPPFLSSHGVVSPMGLLDMQFGGKMTQALADTTNRFGDPKATEAQAIGALVGANFYGMDPEHTRITNMQVMNAKVMDVERQLRYRLMDQGLTETQRAKYLADYQARMQALAEELQEYGRASEVPEQLRVRK